MKLCFYASDKPREQELAKAVTRGARGRGIDTVVKPLTFDPIIEPADIACMVGVKSVRLFHAAEAAGQLPVYFDKGYVRSRRGDARTWEYWRVSVGAHHPTADLMAHKMSGDRLQQFLIELQPWRRSGLQIIIAGSSAKYHEFYNLPDPTTYARRLVEEIRSRVDRPIIYRPKPSWKDAEPITKTYYSGAKESLLSVLANAWCLVTHGSNACFEAAILGVPTIVLGDAVAKPISSISLDEIDAPRLGKREQWLKNLAYFQWTLDELRSGEAWEFIGGLIDEKRERPISPGGS